MFSFYKRHNNKLYTKLAELSRNKFFYQTIKLPDSFESRILLIFFHLAIILQISKNRINKKKTQEIFDNIFQNIEYHIRELGYGDVSVNKNMKNLNKIFYDILYKIDKENQEHEITKILLKKYFFDKGNFDDKKIQILADYLANFRNFCFDLNVNNMLNGAINFNYR